MADVNVVSNLIITASDRTAAAFKSVDQRVDKLAGAFVKTSAVVAAAVGAMAVAGSRAAEDLGKLTTAFGLSTEEAQRLKFQSDLADTSVQAVGKSALKLSTVMGDVLAGKTTGAAGALLQLGITSDQIRETNGDVTKSIALVAEELVKIPPGMQRAEAASRIFGNRLALELLPFLESFAETSQTAKRDLEAFGVALDGIDGEAHAESARNFGDQFDRIKNILQGTGIIIASTLSPTLQGLIDTFRDAAEEEEKFGNDGVSASIKIAAALASVIQVGESVVRVFLSLDLRLDELSRDANQKILEIGALAARVPGFLGNAVAIGMAAMSGGIREEIARLDKQIAEKENALLTKLNKPFFAEKFFDNALAAQQEIVKVVNEAAKFKLGTTTPTGDSGEAKKNADKLKASLERELSAVIRELSTARERADQEFASTVETIKKATNARIIDEARANILIEAARAKHSEVLKAIADTEDEQERARAEKRLALFAQVATDHQKIEQDFAKFQDDIQLARDDEVISEIDKNNLLILAKEQYWERVRALDAENAEEQKKKREEALQQEVTLLEQLTGMRDASLRGLLDFQNLAFTDQLSTVAKVGSDLLGMMAGTSKKAFELHKKFAIAEALISTAQGIALVQSKYVPPLSYALMAAVAVKGAAQVAAIRSQQPGGGGSVRTGGGGGAGGGGLFGGSSAGSSVRESETASLPRPLSNIEVVLQGRNFDREDARALLEQINELVQDNGVNILVR